MAKFNIYFSLLVVAVCHGFGTSAVAAPSIKRLGVGGLTTKDMMSVDKNVAVGRSASVKTIGTKKTTPTTTLTASVPTNNANTSRLSVGKYLHNAGTKANIIKPIGSSISNTEVSDLKELKQKLENDYYTKVEVDEKIDVAKQDTFVNITNNIETTVTNVVNEVVPDKVSEYLNNQATVGEPDWDSSIFD